MAVAAKLPEPEVIIVDGKRRLTRRDLLTVADAAKLLGRTRQAVHLALEAGWLRGFRVFDVVLLDRASVLDYKEKGPRRGPRTVSSPRPRFANATRAPKRARARRRKNVSVSSRA